MQVWLLLFGLFYLAVMPILFLSWLEFFRYDSEVLTGKEKQMSVLVIAIATLFWIAVLPFAYLELLDKFKRSTRAARLYEKLLQAQKPESLAASTEARYSQN